MHISTTPTAAQTSPRGARRSRLVRGGAVVLAIGLMLGSPGLTAHAAPSVATHGPLLMKGGSGGGGGGGSSSGGSNGTLWCENKVRHGIPACTVSNNVVKQGQSMKITASTCLTKRAFKKSHGTATITAKGPSFFTSQAGEPLVFTLRHGQSVQFSSMVAGIYTVGISCDTTSTRALSKEVKLTVTVSG